MPLQVIVSAFVAALIATVVDAAMLLSLMSPDRLGMLGLEVAVIETTLQHLMGVFAARKSAHATGWDMADG
jgi:hypothetical protein